MKSHTYLSATLVLTLVTLGGCATFNDCCYEKSQEVRAVTQYLKCGQPECSCHPHDYKCGWIAGFYEVATGGSTCPPPFAPDTYYKPGVILKDCDSRRHAWYSGWQDGASRAGQFPDTHYLRIYETCECPFPRCDKPCGDGSCGPCQVPFIGLCNSDEMIEIAPTASQPLVMEAVADMEGGFTPAASEDLSIQSSSNRDSDTSEVQTQFERIPMPTQDDAVSATKSETAQPQVDAAAEAFSLFAPESSKTSTQGIVKLVTSGQPIVTKTASAVTATSNAQPAVANAGIVKEVLDNPFEMLESETSK